MIPLSYALYLFFILDDNTCDSICDHHCDHTGSGATPERPRCVCDRGYYLAPDEITCIGMKIL